MKKSLWQHTAAALIALSLLSCKKDYEPKKCDEDTEPSVKVFATGLNSPRGLKFGPSGDLYVAEGGTGGTNSAIGLCTQVPPPVGPFKGSTTGGRISKINSHGVRTTVTDKLPSTTGAMGEIMGVADVTFIGNTLYGLVTGGGCSHGVPSIPNGIVKVNPNGSWSQFSDLSAFWKANPPADPEPGDFEPDGSWYNMIAVDGKLYVVEANGGLLVKVSATGQASLVSDLSASQGHVVPTSVAYHQGNFIIGNLGTFPAAPGGSKLYKVTPGGEVTVLASGFNMILGLAIDNEKRLYVLESTVGSPFPAPGTGRITRVDYWGNKKTIVSNLTLPTGITFGPDGKLYVSNIGFGPAATGGGQVLQIDLCPCDSKGGKDYGW